MKQLRAQEQIEADLTFLFHQIIRQKRYYELLGFHEKHEVNTILAAFYATSIAVLVERRFEGELRNDGTGFLGSMVHQKAKPYFKRLLKNKFNVEVGARNLAKKVFDIIEDYEKIKS